MSIIPLLSTSANTKMKVFCAMLIFYGLCQSGVSEAREKRSYQLPNLKADIKVDAKLDEPVWQQALSISLDYETSPAENSKARVKTEALIFEDGETIYVAFKADDPNPETIKNYLSDRDDVWNSDFVGIKFDTFGEQRKAYQFFVNAAGIQGEAIQEDFVGDDPSWDEIWDAAGRVTESGYIVEIAIPYSALRFPQTGKVQRWSFELTRFMPRDLRYRFANTPVDRNIACQICQYDELIGFASAKATKNIELIPTLVIGQSDIREDPANDPWQKGELDSRASIDLRYGITQDIVLNATIQPDFSQVEADSAQLDVNNTFSLFLAEKRSFFVDGADYFSTPFRFFHSRMLVEPEYGLKVTGQTGSHSFGVMSVADKHTSFLLPGNQGSSTVTIEDRKSDNQILRYRYDLGGKNNLGLLFSDRSADGFDSNLFSFDGRFWFDDNQSITFQHARSNADYDDDVFNNYILEADSEASEQQPTGNADRLDYDYNGRNWWGYARYNRIEQGFRADLGFQNKVDYKRSVYGVGHRWIAEGNDSWWQQWSVQGDWDKSYDLTGKELEEEWEINFRLNAALQSYSRLGITKRNRYYNGFYFDEFQYQFNSELQPLSGLILRFRARWGDKIDFSNTQLGQSTQITPSVEWQIFQNFRLNTELINEQFEVNAGRLFEALVANIRFTWQFDANSFIRFTRQSINIDRNPALYIDEVDSREDFVANQLLYSYKLNPRTLFFAGFSDTGLRDDSLSSLQKTDRSLFMKFSYAWQL